MTHSGRLEIIFQKNSFVRENKSIGIGMVQKGVDFLSLNRPYLTINTIFFANFSVVNDIFKLAMVIITSLERQRL